MPTAGSNTSVAAKTRGASKRALSVVDDGYKPSKRAKALHAVHEGPAVDPGDTSDSIPTDADTPVSPSARRDEDTRDNGRSTTEDAHLPVPAAEKSIPTLHTIDVDDVANTYGKGKAVTRVVLNDNPGSSLEFNESTQFPPSLPIAPRLPAPVDSSGTADKASMSDDVRGTITTVVKPSRLDNVGEFVKPMWVTNEDMVRIVDISLRTNNKDRYPIAVIPAAATWGRPSGTNAGIGTGTMLDPSRFLFLHNKPLRVTITGKVVSTYFFDNDGQAQSRVNIGILPLRKMDMNAYNMLINSRSQPTLDDARDTVYAAKFQRFCIRNMTAATVLPFKRVWDVRTGSRKKTELTPLSASIIGRGDVVMLECHVIRYRPADDTVSYAGKRQNRDWDRWHVALELSDIVYLCRGPDEDGNPAGGADDDDDEY